uniref:Exonuclease domain-containing protein n=1 Tax=Hucho hucho TaxID=62062 RepID=A0A4W5LQ75_9TELE
MYIKPTNAVTDYRTRWSGISWHQLVKAMPFQHARKEILKILAGKVVIGHAVHNDFKSLSYSHPAVLTRDTSRIPLLNQKAGFPEKDVASLKRLTKALFNRNIQTGKKGHSSVEDAKATMELYKVVEVEWERTLKLFLGESWPNTTPTPPLSLLTTTVRQPIGRRSENWQCGARITTSPSM